MQVKLVAITQPVVEGVASAEDFIAYAARVSNPANQHNFDTAPNLLKYLINHNHWSPLEMVNVVMEIETTRDIAHQVVRHRSFSFQEFSQRYADVSALGDSFVPGEARLQDNKNRQNSIETDNQDLADWWLNQQGEIYKRCTATYNEALSRGLAKEVARKVLPEGNTKTRLYMNGSLRSWVHYISLRGANGTQKEHMLVALEAKEIIEELFPSLKGII